MQNRVVVSFVALSLVAIAALGGTGCGRKIGPPPCATQADCADSESCLDGTCTALLGCTTDNECDASKGEVCTGNVCKAGSTQGPTGPGTTSGGGASCTATAGCPMDQFCDTSSGSTCVALPSGWCREASQCSSDKPTCSAQSQAVPGHCVQCTQDADCDGGGTCVNPGVCQGGSGPITPGSGGGTSGGGGTTGGSGGSPNCAAHSHIVNTSCACDYGYIDDGSGTCAVDPNAPPPSSGGGTSGGGGGTSGGNSGSGGGGGVDFCDLFGFYGDGVCDDTCPRPDPDCASGGGTSGGGGGGTSGGGTTGGGGGTSGGSSSGHALNTECVSGGTAETCAGTLTCIVDDATAPTTGTCKQSCTSDSDCDGGSTCAIGFLSASEGICGTPVAPGQTGCTVWSASDNFCFDPHASTSAHATILDCVDNTCQHVCNYTGNTNSMRCPNGSHCSALAPHAGFSVDLAICQ